MSNEPTAEASLHGGANGAGGERTAQAATGGSSNVDKIRELIFGEQMTGYEARFTQLEAKLASEVESLRKMVEASLAELRSNLEKRANEVERASVPRLELASALEKLAAGLRG